MADPQHALTGLTYPERAILALRAIKNNNKICQCQIYHIDSELIVIGLTQNPNEDEVYSVWEGCCEIESGPRQDWIINGAHLVITADMIKAASAFIQSDPQVNDPNAPPQTFLLPGAIFSAWTEEDDDDPTLIHRRALVAFPVEEKVLNRQDIFRHCQFACQWTSALRQNCHVVLNGLWIEDVLPNTDPKKLMQEYDKHPENIEPYIRRRVREAAQAAQERVDKWNAWLDAADGTLLPDGLAVIAEDDGLMGYQENGFTGLIQDPSSEVDWLAYVEEYFE